VADELAKYETIALVHPSTEVPEDDDGLIVEKGGRCWGCADNREYVRAVLVQASTDSDQACHDRERLIQIQRCYNQRMIVHEVRHRHPGRVKSIEACAEKLKAGVVLHSGRGAGMRT
jgi:hypothetical protein